MPTQQWSGSPPGEVDGWVQQRLAEHGAALTDEPVVTRLRPWSSTVRYGTTGGSVWFKANGPGTRHEAAVARALSERVPGLLPDVLAVDAVRGWWLSRDAGPILRDALPAAATWSAWTQLLPRYADAQLRMAPERDLLVAAGLPDVSPRRLPARARDLVRDLARRPAEQGGLTVAQLSALDDWCHRLDRWCAELASCRVPDSIQHDDLHEGNVCWNGSAASARILDWGDASWGSPLGTMLVTLNAVAHARDLSVDAPPVQRLRDAFLEPFTAYADRATMVRLTVLARRAGCVTRALSWRRALEEGGPTAHGDYGFPVRGWLLEALEDGTG